MQTPQAFRAELLRRAHVGEPEATDDAALVEGLGATVRVVPGETSNLKLTEPGDLRVLEAPDGWSCPMSSGPGAPRVGQGFDVHRFSGDPDRRLVLGGVVIEGAAGLKGHSDADVLSHALADAMLGAAGLGDLGGHFPDDAPEWAGASSIGLLTTVAEMIAANRLTVVNADCTVVCERPRLSAHTPAMRSNLAAVLGAPVSVKAKRAEGLGALGRVEGIACLAVVLLSSAGAEAT